MVGEFDILNVDWVNGLVVSPGNSISQHFRIQDLLTTKGQYWFIKEDTRCKLEGNRFDKTTLNHVFSNHEIGE